MAHIVAVLTAALLITAAVWFWNRCIADPDRPEALPPLDDAPEAPEGAAAPAPTPAHRPATGAPLDDATEHPEGTAETATPPEPPPDAPPTLDDTPEAPEGAAETATPPDTPPTVDDTPEAPEGAAETATPPEPPPDTPPTVDDTPEAPEDAAAPAATPGLRWSWRSHRQSGVEFLRVTVTNPGPNPLTVTGIGLRTSDELTRRADPPAGLLEAWDQAVELFGPDSGAAPLPHTLEADGTVDAYFPCRDVADWLYGVAEGENIDRNECHLTPECIDGAGTIHVARRKVDYERWLRHGNGSSLREHLEREEASSAGDDT